VKAKSRFAGSVGTKLSTPMLFVGNTADNITPHKSGRVDENEDTELNVAMMALMKAPLFPRDAQVLWPFKAEAYEHSILR
jgi:hypothetical protein